MSCKIIRIVNNSIADELEIKPGSEILKINGEKPRDFLDYQFLIMNEEIEIEIKTPDGEIIIYEIEKNFEDDIGFIFESAIFDKIKRCANNCIFCFVDQQPEGLRPSLYVKDDDYRLSYLQGTYITLTNLTKKDKERISKLHIGPLYISVHTTNPELRVKMMRNKKAAKLMEELCFLERNKIPIHTQIVLCPDYNDGDELKRTLDDLWQFKTILKSIAIVPLGLTKYRKEELKAVSKEKALETIEIVEKFNKRIKKNIANVSDEIFLTAEKEIPPKDYYNRYCQLNDGVGALSYIIDDFNKRIKKVPKKIKQEKEFTIVCSEIAQKVFYKFGEELNKISGVNVDIKAIRSNFWGKDVNVAGLITASDIINQLKDNCYKDILIPSIMISPYTTEFLDGLKVEDVENAINAKIHIVNDIYKTKEIFDFILKK